MGVLRNQSYLNFFCTFLVNSRKQQPPPLRGTAVGLRSRSAAPRMVRLVNPRGRAHLPRLVNPRGRAQLSYGDRGVRGYSAQQQLVTQNPQINQQVGWYVASCDNSVYQPLFHPVLSFLCPMPYLRLVSWRKRCMD